MNEPLLHLELFGGLRLKRGCAEAADWPPQQSGSLLGFLALNLGRSVSRDELMAAFWPEDEPETSRHKLRQALYALRKQLQEFGFDPDHFLHTARISVRLESTRVVTDVMEFKQLLESAKVASDSKDRADFAESAV